MKPQLKKKTSRDKKYLKWLLTLDCVLNDGSSCGGDMVYHHSSTGGMSLKGSDYDAIPVCFAHHDLFNNTGKRGAGLFKEGELQQIIEKLNSEWSVKNGTAKKKSETV
jgi:hypothetical protein